MKPVRPLRLTVSGWLARHCTIPSPTAQPGQRPSPPPPPAAPWGRGFHTSAPRLMTPFTQWTGVAAPLPLLNVDTDLIIPAWLRAAG